MFITLSVLKYLLKWMARFILFIAGWRLFSQEEKRKLHSEDKAVYIYPHTSIWDFVVGVLYMFAQPDILKDGYFVMKPQPFEKWYGFILRKGRFIPATRREESGEGFVTKTVKYLSIKDKAYLFISPEGTRVANDWKTGFFYLAQEMNVKIGIVGLDYELQEPVVKNLHDYDDYESYDELKKVLMADMESIVPLYPSSSGSPVRKYIITKLINKHTVASKLSCIILVFVLIYNFFF